MLACMHACMRSSENDKVESFFWRVSFGRARSGRTLGLFSDVSIEGVIS